MAIVYNLVLYIYVAACARERSEMKSKHAKQILLMLIVTGILSIFAGCISARNDIPSATIENWGTETATMSFLPYSLNCSRISGEQVGLTWNNLTIGESTLTEVEEALAPAEFLWDTDAGNLRFVNQGPGSKTTPRAPWRD